jgi:serine/threonine-protein kinase RsbW
MSREVVLEIPARLDYLAVVRLVVATAATLDPPLSESRLEDLRLAVSEACSNAVKAHASEEAPEPVVIRCNVGPEAFVVEIIDHGPGFDPAELSALPEVTDPERLEHEGGLGIPLIKVLSDQVSFRQHPNGMAVKMTFSRPAPAT